MTQNATRGYASDIQPRMEQISAAKTQHLAVLLVVIQWWFCYILPQNRDLFSMILLHEVSSVKITFPQTTNFRAKKDEKSRIILCINNHGRRSGKSGKYGTRCSSPTFHLHSKQQKTFWSKKSKVSKLNFFVAGQVKDYKF